MSCEDNLELFVQTVSAKISERDWAARSWKLRVTKSGTAPCVSNVSFTLEGQGPGAAVDFDPRFGRFARAVIGHIEGKYLKPSSRTCYDRMIWALRLLHAAFGDDAADPAALTSLHFERALAAARERFASNLYFTQIRTRLVEAADLVKAYGLSLLPLKWKPWLGELEDNREGLPALDFAQISALAQISLREDLCLADQIKRCVTDLCLCGGFRIEEALTLPVDAHVTRAAFDADGARMVDADGRPVLLHGLRYWAGKGESRDVMVKPIPSAMVPLMLRAIERAKSLTEGPRAVARYQAEHEGTTVLGSSLDELEDDTPLPAVDVEEALGLTAGRDWGAAGTLFIRNNKVPSVEQRELGESGWHRKVTYVEKGDLYRRLYDLSDRGDMREREVDEFVGLETLLFVVHKGLEGDNPGIRGTARLLRYSSIVNYLCDTAAFKGSIFTRLGYLDENGGPISVSSHQFRVTMNNMAQSLGVGQAEIARWMGRTTLAVNAAYDKREPLEKAAKLRAGLERGGAYPPDRPLVHRPLGASEWEVDETTAAHISGVGVCHHDFASLPCPAHGALVQAGFRDGLYGSEKEEEVLDRTEQLLIASERAEADGVYGAAAWSVAHREAIMALRCRSEHGEGGTR